MRLRPDSVTCVHRGLVTKSIKKVLQCKDIPVLVSLSPNDFKQNEKAIHHHIAVNTVLFFCL